MHLHYIEKVIRKIALLPSETVIIKILRLFYQHIIPRNRPLPILFGRLKGKKWFIESSDYSFWTGTVRNSLQHLLIKMVKKGKVFYDLGAHVGFFTLLAAELVGPSGRVVAFEPLPRNLNYLKKHLASNHIKNVTIIEAAAYDTSTVVTFSESQKHQNAKISSIGSIKIRTVAIDKMVEQGKIPPPDYMKINIEGSEVEALKGAELVFQRTRPIIFLSTHGAGIHYECYRYLELLGYKIENTNEKSDHFSELIAYQ